jgi:hypothetical protein
MWTHDEPEKQGGNMKLEQVLKTAGSAALASFPPYGPLALAAINAILPNGQKLPESVTGDMAEGALKSVPSEQRAQVLNQELKLKETEIKEVGESTRTMLIHDARNPQSTRPYIAKGCFLILGAVALMITAAVLIASIRDMTQVIMSLSASWELIAVVIGPLVYVLKAYFGAIQTEQKQRFNAANGFNIETGIASVMSALKK